MRHARGAVARCWECEAATDRPATVMLRLEVGRVGPLTLCPACYRACYLPLMTAGIEPVDLAPGRPIRAIVRPDPAR